MKRLTYTILAIIYICSCNNEIEHISADVETLGTTNMTDTEAVCWGRITENGTTGIVEFGIELNDPTNGITKIPYNIFRVDSFAVRQKDLTNDSQYQYRAYIIEKNGEVFYGEYDNFITFETIKFSMFAHNITDTTAEIHFTNTEQLLEWGLFYLDSDGKNTKVDANNELIIYLTDLEPDGTYQIRGYAVDKNGLEIFSQIHFSTPPEFNAL